MASAASDGLGSSETAPLANPKFDARQSQLTPEDYFVLTRVDGKTPVKQLVLITGFGADRTVAILRKLREAGAIYLPGETPPARAPASTPATGTLAAVQIDESLVLEECDLTPEQRRVILVKHASLKGANFFDALEIPRDADKKTVKRSYFRISKDFHPDRFYGKNLGSFRARLDEIFAFAARAFEELEDDAKRAAYEATLAAGPGGRKPITKPPVGPSPAQRAQEIYERACQHQVTGDLEKALHEFAAALTLDPQPRYLRRAAEAALRAQELRSAEEYATKAAQLDPRDAGGRRTLAKVYKALGRVADAITELESASRLDPENAYIAAELDELRKS